MSKIYARVKEGKIVEYPVHEIHIKNRAHPVSWYHECIYTPEPVLTPYHYRKEVLMVEGDVVKVTYTEVPMNLKQLITVMNNGKSPSYGHGPFNEEVVQDQISFQTLDPLLISKINDLIKIYAQSKLDTFIATRGYDSVVSAASYKDSTVPQFAAEATRVIQLRDLTWSNLYTYLTNVMEGTVPVPFSIRDIDAILPVYTWD